MDEVALARRILGSDVDIIQGFAFGSDGFSKDEGLPLIRIRDLTVGRTETRYFGPYSDKYFIEPGDVLIGMDGDFKVVRWSGEKALLNQRVCRIRSTSSSIDNGFLFHAIKPEIDRVHKLTPQTTVRHLNTNGIRSCTVLDVSLEEQRRITEVLDTIDETIQATKHIVAKLRRVQTGALYAAMEATVLTGRRSTVEQEFDIESGITLNASRVPRSNTIGYLRVANVQRNYIDTSDLAELETTEEEIARKMLLTGDLVLVEGHANPSEIGRCSVVTALAEGLLFQNHLFRLRSRSIPSEIAQLILNSEEAKAYWQRMCATSSGLYTINSSMLRKMPISIPDSHSQRVVSRTIETSNALISVQVSQLRKLQEIRAGLANDLLSGRVRTVAA